MKNVRSSQPCISMNFVLNSVKHKFLFHVSIVKLLVRRHVSSVSKETSWILVTRVFGNERLNTDKKPLPISPKAALGQKKRKKRMTMNSILRYT